MEEYGEDECEQLFRFGKLGFERLLYGLQLPTHYHCSQKTIAISRGALLILLRRLAYPNWWCNLVTRFSRTESEMSLIFKEILDDIHHRFCYLLEVWLDPHCFAKAVQDAGAPLDNCWGFIDGTAHPIAREEPKKTTGKHDKDGSIIKVL